MRVEGISKAPEVSLRHLCSERQGRELSVISEFVRVAPLILRYPPSWHRTALNEGARPELGVSLLELALGIHNDGPTERNRLPQGLARQHQHLKLCFSTTNLNFCNTVGPLI